MPSNMIHLLAAKLLGEAAENAGRPDIYRSPLYWAAAIAPDAVYEREPKDESHFRLEPDRESALRAYAEPKKDPFGVGVVFHLYLDFLWDNECLPEYREWYERTVRGDGWFSPYRKEIGKTSAWLYHHLDWAKGVWAQMDGCDPAAYGPVRNADAETVCAYIRRSYKWHRENDIPASDFFTPEYAERFAASAAERFLAWRER